MQKRLVKFRSFIHQHVLSITIIFIALIAFYFRTYNINWDNNFYFHPDERAIVMFTIPLEFPKDIASFLSFNSPLNPHFFAYGNFPLYLLKIAGVLASHINPTYGMYGGIHIVGRLLSAIFDALTVFVIFFLAKKCFSKKAALFASLFYALSVLPIQLSHFYAVDTLLTFFMTTTLLFLINFYKTFNKKYSLLIGLFLGLSLATKISALVIIFYILFMFAILLLRKKTKFLKLLGNLLLIFLTAILIFIVLQPYTLLDFKEFLQQTELQSQMSKNAFLFPYTLQYVGKLPYLYEFKNIFLWGQGPLLSILCLGGILSFPYFFIKNKFKRFSYASLLFVYMLLYFLLFGSFAVKFMRYMLPVYPLFCLFAGFFIGEIVIPKIPKKYISNYFFRKGLLFCFVIIVLIYPLSFLSIYNHPNTRIQASDWINQNIPYGSTVAVEHWDDALPVYGNQNYKQMTLPLYDPDTPQKWEGIDATLKNTDYIFIASNRLYVPLQKLSNCSKIPVYKCYPQTARYYQKLFSGKLGFRKVAEFVEYPTIPLTNIKINDDTADESFTVTDHPKVMIFKKD